MKKTLKISIIMLSIIIFVGGIMVFWKMFTYQRSDQGQAVRLAKIETKKYVKKIPPVSSVEKKEYSIWVVTFDDNKVNDDEIWVTVDTLRKKVTEINSAWGLLYK